MPSFKFLIFLSSLFVISLFSLPNGNEAAPTYLHHFCSGTSFTADSTFKSNLDIVLSSLSSNGTRATGFSSASAGEMSGLFLCRGDVNTTVCQDCVANATKEILQACPLQFGAVIWYDECLLHYSNESILATINEAPMVQWANSSYLEVGRDRFNRLLDNTMNSLLTLASNSLTGKKFATKEEEFDSSQTLYSLVQCTPDLKVSDCYKCIRDAIGVLPMCCDGKQGGRVLLPSCIVRYELYPFYNVTATSPAFPPLPPGGNNTKKIIIISTTVSSIAVVAALFGFWHYSSFGRRKKEEDGREMSQANMLGNWEGSQSIHFMDRGIHARDQDNSGEMHYFNLSTVQAATNNFCDANKLGEGGFGPVYKGKLIDGKEIAVKRLSMKSKQGLEEFRNEVLLIVKLQHRHLVRLLGCCLEGGEKLLVYEYMANTSLDAFLFDPKKSVLLDWAKRVNILNGIARGLLYLHEDSRLKIIHRDMKASNVLLDDEMNPKISDFGTARIFDSNQIEANTNRVVGTYGYMAPEYAMEGIFSVKSDVYSFGVLMLEIISGKKNTGFYHPEHEESLLPHAWRVWNEGKGLELINQTLVDTCPESEALRLIHIALLCVQEDPDERPTMSIVVLMLGSSLINLPRPLPPPFSLGRSILSNQSSTTGAMIGFFASNQSSTSASTQSRD